MLRVFESSELAAKVATTLDKDGEPLFLAKDVATSLGYQNTNWAIQTHVSEKYKIRFGKVGQVLAGRETRPRGIQPSTVFLQEPGLYELLFSSHLPLARAFREWVFEEVLPSIRKTGKYEVEDPISKVLSIELDELAAYDKEERKEYKTIILSHYNLLKDEKRQKSGRNGGLSTQQKIRETKDELESLEEVVESQNEFIDTALRASW